MCFNTQDDYHKTIRALRLINTADNHGQGQTFTQGGADMKDSEELIKDLKHKDSSVRRHAVEMLGIIGDKKAVDALILVLKDKNRFVRQEAIAALGKIGSARLVEPLTQSLEEEKDEFVIDSIKKVLEKLHLHVS